MPTVSPNRRRWWSLAASALLALPASAHPVLITELAHDGVNTFVELYNAGDVAVPLDTWQLCINPGLSYSFNALDGWIIEPGDTLVVQLGGVLDPTLADVVVIFMHVTTYSEGDFGIYDFGAEPWDFKNPAFLRDYLQWGAAGQTREPVGVGAGLWAEGDFVPGTLEESSIQLDGDEVQGGATPSTAFTVVPFADHNLGIFPPPEPPSAGDGDADGDGDVDLDDFALMVDCALGPDVPVVGECPVFDFDADGDVDLADYSAFMLAFTVVPLNQPPTAAAGPDVTAQQGQPVALDGSGSSDPDGVIASYCWTQVAGPPVLAETCAAQVNIVTPTGLTSPVVMTFKLTVTDDGGASDDDFVNVAVEVPSAGSVLITELANNGVNTFVELYNPGGTAVPLDNWQLCINPGLSYSNDDLDGRSVAPGATLVVQIGGVLDPSIADVRVEMFVNTTVVGDFGIYEFTGTTINFADPAALRDYLQWGAAGQFREPVGAGAGLWSAGQFVPGGLGNSALQLSADETDGGLTPASAYTNVVFAEQNLGVFPPPEPDAEATGELLLTEVADDGSRTFMEIYNPGDEAIALDNWALWWKGQTTSAAALTGLTVQARRTFVIQLRGGLDAALADRSVPMTVGSTSSGDAALFDFTGSSGRDFDDSRMMVDYLQWGAANAPGRTSADNAGLWSAADFIDSPLGGSSFSLNGERAEGGLTASTDYETAPFEEHSLRQFPPPEPPPVTGRIVITELANDGDNTFLELYNPGETAVGLDNWQVCVNPGFIYSGTALAGVELGGGEALVLQLGGLQRDAVADVLVQSVAVFVLSRGDMAMYDFTGATIDFTDPATMKTYLQWGADAQNRENVAAAAGIWIAGDFIGFALAGNSFQIAPASIDVALLTPDDFLITAFVDNSLGVVAVPDEPAPPVETPPAEDPVDDDLPPPASEPPTDETPAENPPADNGGDAGAGVPGNGDQTGNPSDDAQEPDRPARRNRSAGGLCGLFGLGQLVAMAVTMITARLHGRHRARSRQSIDRR